jgi:Flp pilus assembly protein TadG
MVESTVSFVVLVLLLFGIIEMGWMFRSKGILGNAARQAARSVAAGDSVTVAKQKANACADNLPNVAYTFTEGSVDTNGNFVATGSVRDDTTVSPSTNTALPGDLIQVTAQYNHHYLTGLIGKGTVSLQSQVVMQREQ